MFFYFFNCYIIDMVFCNSCFFVIILVCLWCIFIFRKIKVIIVVEIIRVICSVFRCIFSVVFYQDIVKVRIVIVDIIGFSVDDFFRDIVKVFIGKQFCGFFEIQNGKLQFVKFIIDMCVFVDDLFEFGYILNVLIEYYQFIGFGINICCYKF